MCLIFFPKYFLSLTFVTIYLPSSKKTIISSTLEHLLTNSSLDNLVPIKPSFLLTNNFLLAIDTLLTEIESNSAICVFLCLSLPYFLIRCS